MLTKIPRAPERSTSSSNGERIAISAAFAARFSPVAVPVPIIALPISLMTVRTSAKSTLIIPGRIIRSAIPRTAPCNTLFASANAVINDAFFPSTGRSFSFGTTIRESTCFSSAVMPWSATWVRRRPSKPNGRVTIATVRIPISLAISATTGAAPVPVPPPMPAVINTMSVSTSTSAIASRSSSAALRPTSGLAPAPNPLVISPPS